MFILRLFYKAITEFFFTLLTLTNTVYVIIYILFLLFRLLEVEIAQEILKSELLVSEVPKL